MEIGCRCQVEDMRQGVFCDTCRLLVRVHKYMLDLFKEAAKREDKIGQGVSKRGIKKK